MLGFIFCCCKKIPSFYQKKNVLLKRPSLLRIFINYIRKKFDEIRSWCFSEQIIFYSLKHKILDLFFIVLLYDGYNVNYYTLGDCWMVDLNIPSTKKNRFQRSYKISKFIINDLFIIIRDNLLISDFENKAIQVFN